MSDPVAVLTAFIDEVNRGDMAAALARLTEDVCIVEDLAPYRWSGPEAGGQWLAAMGANAARQGISAISMTAGEAQRVEVEGEHAYCILPGRLRYHRAEDVRAVDGLLTFVLRLANGEWRISAFAWTGNRAEPE